MKIHELKIKEEYFEEILKGNKTFELRKNDRNYEVGDLIHFNIFENLKNPYEKIEVRATYNGKDLFEITYILKNVPEYGLDKDYCILGIKKLDTKN